MCLGFWELSFIFTLIILIVAAGVLLYFTYRKGKSIQNQQVLKGLSTSGIGTIAKLQCPANKSINVTRAVYVCSNPTLVEEGQTNYYKEGSCDPYYNSNGQLSSLYNPLTTTDASAIVSKLCNGKGECSYTLSSGDANSAAMCQNGTSPSGCDGTIQLVGSYTCN